MTKTTYPTIDEKVKSSIEGLRLTSEQIKTLNEKYPNFPANPHEEYSFGIGRLPYVFDAIVCAVLYDQAQKYIDSGRSLNDFKQDWEIAIFPSDNRHGSQRYAIGFNAEKLRELLYIPEIAYNDLLIPDFGYEIPEGQRKVMEVTKTSDYTRFYLWGHANVIEHINPVTSILIDKGMRDISESVVGLSDVGSKLESASDPFAEELLGQGLHLGKEIFRLYATHNRMKTKPEYPYSDAPKKPELVNTLLDYYERVIESI